MIPDYILLGLLIAINIIGIVIIVVLLKRKKHGEPVKVEINEEETLRQIKFMHEKIATLKVELESSFKERFGEQTEKINENDQKFLAKMQSEIDTKLEKLLESVQKKMTEDANVTKKTYGELGEKIQAITSMKEELDSFSSDVKNLANVISGENQKRGKFGEFLLENILGHVFAGLPDLYTTQKSIGNVRPDAIIYLPREQNNKLCIDAKFPYTNFIDVFDEEGNEIPEAKRQFLSDVKTKIDEVKAKYIIAGETLEYALCFFPSDEVFNYLHNNSPQTIEYARNNNVVIVSPSTLQPTLYTLRALMIDYRLSKRLIETNQELIKLANDFRLLEERWGRLTSQLDTVINSRDNFDRTFSRLANRFDKINTAKDFDEN